MTDEHRDQPDEHARERIRRAIEESARSDEDQRSRQRNTGIAIGVLAVVVIGLLVAMVSGMMPNP